MSSVLYAVLLLVSPLLLLHHLQKQGVHEPVNPEHLPYLLQGVQGTAEQKWDVCSVQGAVCRVLYAVCRLGIRCNQCLCKFCGARVKSSLREKKSWGYILEICWQFWQFLYAFLKSYHKFWEIYAFIWVNLLWLKPWLFKKIVFF